MAPLMSVPVIISLTALILVLFLTVPSIHSIARRPHFRPKDYQDDSISKTYEDEDGVASEEAEGAYSATVPKYIAMASTVIGLIVNVITNVYTVIKPDLRSHLGSWIIFGSWVGRVSSLTQIIH